MNRDKEPVFTAHEVLENLPDLDLTVRIEADLKDGVIDQDSGQVILGFAGCMYEGRGNDHESAYANFVSTFSRQGNWTDLPEDVRSFNDPAVYLAIKANLVADELRAVAQLPPSDSST